MLLTQSRRSWDSYRNCFQNVNSTEQIDLATSELAIRRYRRTHQKADRLLMPSHTVVLPENCSVCVRYKGLLFNHYARRDDGPVLAPTDTGPDNSKSL